MKAFRVIVKSVVSISVVTLYLAVFTYFASNNTPSQDFKIFLNCILNVAYIIGCFGAIAIFSVLFWNLAFWCVEDRHWGKFK